MNVEQALGTLEAHLAGGDELGAVSEVEAKAAINVLRALLQVIHELQAIAPKARAEQDELKEKLATLRTQLAAVTAERDALKAQLAAVTAEHDVFRAGRLVVDPQDVSSKTSQPANQSAPWLWLKTSMENGVHEKRLHLSIEGDGAEIEIEVWGIRMSYQLDQMEMREVAFWLVNHSEPIPRG